MAVVLCGWVVLTLMVVTVSCYNRNPEEMHLSVEDEHESRSDVWGLFDAHATAGLIFTYNLSTFLPFQESTMYMVSESNSNKLPGWLEYDESNGCLLGIPGSDDANKIFYIQVTFWDKFHISSTLTDVFSIEVTAFNPYSLPTLSQSLGGRYNNSTVITCLPGSSVTTTTVVIDTDFQALSPFKRVKILRHAAKFLGLAAVQMRLTPADDLSQMAKVVLIAGPGDVQASSSNITSLQWEVGCGNVVAFHIDRLEELERVSQNGRLHNAVGYGVVGWYVTDQKPSSHIRLKRSAVDSSVFATATPIPTARLPVTKANIPTVTVIESKVLGVPPSTRVLPTLSSLPLTPGIDVTSPRMKPRPTRSRTLKPSKVRPNEFSTSAAPPGYVDVAKERSSEPILPTTASVVNNGLEPSMMMPKTTRVLPTESLAYKTAGLTKPPSRKQVRTSGWDSILNPKPENNFIGKTTPRDISPPVVNREIGTLDVKVGHVFTFKIPNDVFVDDVDGGTANLKLTLTNSDGNSVGLESWIGLNETTQTLFCLPLEVQYQQYFLSATNSRGQTSRCGFYINVQKLSADLSINFLMSLVLDINYNSFISNVALQIEVAHKISNAFGDADASNLMVTSIVPGSVKISWTNSTLSSKPCPKNAIVAHAEYFILSNGSLNNRFIQELKQFTIKHAEVVPQESGCAFQAKAFKAEPSASTGIPAANIAGVSSDVFFATIIPILVFTAIIIFAIVLACCLCCRRSKTKKAIINEARAVKKGAPVIFPTELEDECNSANKPLILEDEKPPQAPDYLSADANYQSPRWKHRELLPLDDGNGLAKQPHRHPSGGRELALRNPPQYPTS